MICYWHVTVLNVYGTKSLQSLILNMYSIDDEDDDDEEDFEEPPLKSPPPTPDRKFNSMSEADKVDLQKNYAKINLTGYDLFGFIWKYLVN